jgi:hypothetical protein
VLNQALLNSEGKIAPSAPLGCADATPQTRLVPFGFWLPRAPELAARRIPPDPSDLRAAIRVHLGEVGCSAAEPLRWAITAVDAQRGLQLEGVAICEALVAQQAA